MEIGDFLKALRGAVEEACEERKSQNNREGDLDITSALKALKDGKKVGCENDGDGEYITMNKKGYILNQDGERLGIKVCNVTDKSYYIVD